MGCQVIFCFFEFSKINFGFQTVVYIYIYMERETILIGTSASQSVIMFRWIWWWKIIFSGVPFIIKLLFSWYTSSRLPLYIKPNLSIIKPTRRKLSICLQSIVLLYFLVKITHYASILRQPFTHIDKPRLASQSTVQHNLSHTQTKQTTDRLSYHRQMFSYSVDDIQRFDKNKKINKLSQILWPSFFFLFAEKNQNQNR